MSQRTTEGKASRGGSNGGVPRLEQGSLDAAMAGRDAGDEIGYRGPQVCKIVGITYRPLDYWARTELVRPSLADARGSGTQRRRSPFLPGGPQLNYNLPDVRAQRYAAPTALALGPSA